MTAKSKSCLPEENATLLAPVQVALMASETRYRRLFEAAKNGILILDADTGRITDANPFLQDLLGYSRVELLGKMLWEIGPFRDIAASRGAFRKLQRKKYIRYDNLPLETKGHRHRHVEFVSNVYQENSTRVIQCNIRDITQRHQAEVALANAGKELEKRVDERTAELLTANRLMKKMLDEGKRAEERIRKSREQLRNLSGGLQSRLEEERTRISREIHDELGQSLTALKMDLSLIRRKILSEGLAEQSAKVHEVELAVSRIIRTVRKIATDLRPGILDELGVVAAIEWVAKNFQSRTGISCKVAVRGADTDIRPRPLHGDLPHRPGGPDECLALCGGVAGEGEPGEERRYPDRRGERQRDRDQWKDGLSDSKSLGLIGIRERVLLLGGEAEISGKPGEGTVVRVTLPIEEGANPND